MNIEKADYNPMISIIVPIYNVAKYLKQCLESLINQTLKEIEIICVNDGSTDQSQEILDEYVKKDNRMIVISKTNSGYGHSMNVGMQHARGKYIGIVESDDFVEKNMFEQLFLKAEETNIDVVKSNYYTYCLTERKYCENLKELPYNTIFKPEEYLKIFSVAPSIWSCLYKADFLKQHHITFHETKGASYQDVSFFFLVLLYARSMICMKDAFLNYRIDNINSSVHSKEKIFCIMHEFERIQNYYLQEKKKELLKVIVAEKFRNYIGNYRRIDPLFQYAYLQKMHKEFIEDEKNGMLNKEYWTNDEWDELQKIKNNPDEYFKNTNIDYINRYQLNNFAMNRNIQIEACKDAIKKASKIIIYGAGLYAKKLTREIKILHPIFAYAVTKQNAGDIEEIDGVKVYEIINLKRYVEEALVIVAVKKASQPSIIGLLHEIGFQQIIYVDSPTLEEE